MPKGIQKSIQVYFSKLRKPASEDPVQGTSTVGRSVLPDPPHAGPAGWLLSACKHPRTPSFAADDRDVDRRNEEAPDEAAATLKDVDRFLFENFRSLYKDVPRRNDDDDGGGGDDGEEDEGSKNINNAILCESPTFVKTPPNLRSSQRFFVSTSADNSLFDVGRPYDDPRSTSSSTPGGTCAPGLPGDSLAVLTYSRRPYDDFRRSMQEMVEARQRDQEGAAQQPMDWDFMEELLFCYLRLNERRAHKYILGAFVDLVVSFRVTKTAPAASRPRRKKKKAPREWRRRWRNAESSDERY